MKNDKAIRNNKPDIVISDDETRKRLLMEVAISGHRNVTKKEAEKTIKYEQHMI